MFIRLNGSIFIIIVKKMIWDQSNSWNDWDDKIFISIFVISLISVYDRHPKNTFSTDGGKNIRVIGSI